MTGRNRVRVKEIEIVCGGKILCGDPEAEIANITTSSLEIKGEDLFVPIVGERTDGHKYIQNALRDGAAASLSERDDILSEKPVIRVESSVEALLRIGGWYRRNYLSMPVIGVTGSVGKTTTREMIATALSAEKKVYSTKKNLNSQVGVPMTVFEADTTADICVLELGMSEFHEMEKISEAAQPTDAVITNIGVCHIMNLGTQENILKEKLKILTGMPSPARLLLNGDDPILREMTEEKIHSFGIAEEKEIRILFYGTGENARYIAKDIVTSEEGKTFVFADRDTGKEQPVSLSVLADFMVMNAVCALAEACLHDVDLSEAAGKLKSFTGLSGRGEILQKNGYRVIDDCYNAAPATMKGALKTLSDMKVSGRRIACLADMLETGELEKDYHREVGSYLAGLKEPPAELFLYGTLSRLIGEAAGKAGYRGTVRCYGKEEFDLLKKDVYDSVKEGDVLLLKGSNSMDLKRLL